VAKTPVRRKPDEGATPGMTSKKTTQRQGFKIGEFIVYPAHGVGQIVSIDEQEIAGAKLELFVITFAKARWTACPLPPTIICLPMYCAAGGDSKVSRSPIIRASTK